MKLSSVLFLVVIFCTNYVHNANILGFFPIASVSHQVVYQPIWRELSLRGHQVTVITPNPLNDPTLVNLTEISISHVYDAFKTNRLDNLASKDTSGFLVIKNLFTLQSKVLEIAFNSSKVQELMRDNKKSFDLVFVENFHPGALAVAARFDAPIISVYSMGDLLHFYDSVGNPNHPVLYPDMLLSYRDNLSLFERIESTLYNAWAKFYFSYFVLPQAQQLAAKYFGNNIPDLRDVEKNISMVFLSMNPIINPARPQVPAIVQLSHMHVKPAKPLPKDLQKILDEAKNGVVYFSLGSNMKSVNMRDELRNNIIKALSELPYTVLWKWESDDLPDKPDNVIIRKWLPQLDVLAHPNVKVFVTQCGLQSIEESISRGVPLVGMPFMIDQPMNLHSIVNAGVAIGVDPTTVTTEELKNAIVEVAENNKFRNKARELQELLNDQPMTSLEKAVWWTEYVIRHKGAKQLKSATVDISWYKYLLLDVVGVLVLVAAVFTYLLYKLVILALTNDRHKFKVT